MRISTGPIVHWATISAPTFPVHLLVIGRLLQESQSIETTLTESAATTDTNATAQDNHSSSDGTSTILDGTSAVISGTSTGIVDDPSAGQSSIEQQTSQLAAGASRL